MKLINYIWSKNFSDDTKLQNQLKLKHALTLHITFSIISFLILILEMLTNINLLPVLLSVLFVDLYCFSLLLYNINSKKFKIIDIVLSYIIILPTVFSLILFIIRLFYKENILLMVKIPIFILGIILIVFVRSIYKKGSFYTNFSVTEGQNLLKINSGTHLVGKNIETGEPVGVPLNDRFVHMLIIGATGTGKSSQILLPMINQDLQNSELGSIIIEPKSDLAEKAYQLALHYGRNAMYFNPMLKNCPYFNPLYGNEDDVIENLATAFRMLDPDSSMFFQNQAENLIRKSLKVLKRLYGNDATLIDLNSLLWNTDNEGRKILIEFNKKVKPNHFKEENDELYHWFMSDYFTGSTGDKNGTKTYEHTSGIRTQVAKLCSNKYLRRVLNPPKGVGSDVDFVRALANSEVVCIATAQGDLQALGSYLGYFLILQLQAAVFKRPGDERTRKPCVLTIDEFQVFANPGFSNMLTQGRSYRVPCILATQNLALIGMNSGRQGKDFSELVKTNARNLIVFPGCNYQDADYFSKLFGEDIVQVEKKSTSRAKFNPFLNWNLKAPSESISYVDEKKVRFSPTDLINMKFTEVVCRLINNNSVMPATKCKISFIDKKLNEEMDKRVYEFREQNIIDTSIDDYEDSIEVKNEFNDLKKYPNDLVDLEFFKFDDNDGVKNIEITDDEDDL